MDQTPESPSGLVSRLQGWLLPDKDDQVTAPPVTTPPTVITRKQRAVSVFSRLTQSTTPPGKKATSRPTEADGRAERVLQFWFGGDMHTNYKTKWFPDGSAETQKRADETIFKLFGDLFRSAINGDLVEWKKELRSTVALIVVLDQFSRHIYRLEKVPTDDVRRSNVDALALATSEDLTSRYGWDTDLSVHEFVFSLMPFRHTPTTDTRESTEKESLDLLLKFRKQTVRRLQHLQDIQKSTESDSILEQPAFLADETNMPNCPLVLSTELFLRKYLRTMKGLEGGLGGVGAGSMGGSLYQQAVKKGGKSEGREGREVEYCLDSPTVRSAGSSRFRGRLPVDPIPDRNLDYLNSLEPVAISLSGGVDSMVIAKILVHLRHTDRLPIGRIIAIHIDYANRAESGEEAQFVRDWCEELGIECYVRVVDEVTRGITGRDEYEKVSRDIRYSFYQSILGSTGCAGVIFGHHLGDVQENVISNVLRGSSPLALSGMTEAGISNGVHVWRPLLAHPKTDILDFARDYGVPYFKDTTPSWSTRGKLRTLLMPLLVDMYGEGCIKSLSSLAVESDETAELVNKNIYTPFLQSVIRLPCGLCVDISPYYYQPLCFWREMLKQLMHSMGMSMVRERSVKSFLGRIQTRKYSDDLPLIPSSSSSSSAAAAPLPPPKSAVGWLELRKGFHTMLCDDGCLLILRDGVLSSPTKNKECLTKAAESNQRVLTDKEVPYIEVNMGWQTTDRQTDDSNNNQNKGVENSHTVKSDKDASSRTYTDDDKADQSPDQLPPTPAIPQGPVLGADPSPHWPEGVRFEIDRILGPSPSTPSLPVCVVIGTWSVRIYRVSSRSNTDTLGQGQGEEGGGEREGEGLDTSIKPYSSTPGITAIPGIPSSEAEKRTHEEGENVKEVTTDSEKIGNTFTNITSNKVRGADHVRTLQSVRSLLEGRFQYHLSVPSYCTHLSVPPPQMRSSSSSSPSSSGHSNKGKIVEMETIELEVASKQNKVLKEEVFLEAPALSGIDPRLKAGLPLLVPIALRDDLLLETDFSKNLLLRLEYTFSPQKDSHL